MERYQFKCPVIFTTAYDEYALKAFRVNGIDYLLTFLGEKYLLDFVTLEEIEELLNPDFISAPIHTVLCTSMRFKASNRMKIRN